MKLTENTIEDEKENTCNGNGLPGKPFIKEISSSDPSNGDIHDDSESNEPAPGVGDLLVEDTNPTRNDSEENSFQNDSRADDNTSISSNSSNFPITEQDDTDDDEITLRLSEEEDLSEPVNNETDNLYFNSSKSLPEQDEEKDKVEEKSTSDEKDNSNSEVPKDTNKLVVEEELNNSKPSECENSENNDKNSSPEKADDNLDNLISDLNEDSKSALKSENEKVTISDLRQEIEDFIKNHDAEDKEPKSKDLEPEPSNSKNKDEITTNTETVDAEMKTDETKSNETKVKIEISETKSEKLEEENAESEMKDDSIEINDNSTEINENSIDIKEELLEESPKNVSNLLESNDSLFSKIKIESFSSTTEKTNEDTDSESAQTTPEEISEKSDETTDKIFSEYASTDESETKSSIDETVDTEETNATENIVIINPKIDDFDTSSCQKIIDISETSETETSNQVETETEILKVQSDETDNSEILKAIPVKVDCEVTENNDSNTEVEEKQYTELKNAFYAPMDVDFSGSESSIENNEPKNIDKPAIINNDDIVMKDDFDSIKETPNNQDTDNKVLTKNQEDNLLIKNKDIKDDEVKSNKIEVIEQDGTKQEDKKGNEDCQKPEEERTSLKRNLENEEEAQDAKKPKINGVKITKESDIEYVRLDIFREFMSKKEISTLTRAEIEQFCLQKMCEAITQSSKIGELNRKVMQQEGTIEALRTKYTSLTKQVRDLEVVHSRVLQEVRAKVKEGNIEVTPVKITRSVGLQVSLQPIQGRVRQILPGPDISTHGGVKRKLQQRTSLPNKLPAPSPSNSMPPPAVPPIHKSPNTGKGIKTILPKVYPPAESKDNNSSLLGTILQTSSTSKSPSTSSARKSAPAATPSTSAGPSTSTPKVIDLTDEDDTQKASGSGASSSSGNIRVVPPQQLQSTSTTPVTSASLPRLTYLVQGNQQGQQVLLATSTAPTRPGQVRSTLMFKPVAPGQVPPGQRVNLVRPNTVPGITVLPSTSSQPIRPGQQIRFATPAVPRPQVRASAPTRHPAPLPGPPAVQPSQPNWKAMPPKPSLKISRVGDGIVLSWRMQNNKDMSLYEEIGSYQLYAYQETNGPPSTDMWRKVGDVKALALPMACTLTQFTDGNKYHFAVRAVDVKSRVGPFSQPEQIALP